MYHSSTEPGWSAGRVGTDVLEDLVQLGRISITDLPGPCLAYRIDGGDTGLYERLHELLAYCRAVEQPLGCQLGICGGSLVDRMGDVSKGTGPRLSGFVLAGQLQEL